jgi:hypothetical protein
VRATPWLEIRESPAYTFTLVAQTDDEVFAFDGRPGINDAGTVAFKARTESDQRVVTGNGGALTTIASRGTQGITDFGNRFPIDNNGNVAFVAALDSEETAIFRGDDESVAFDPAVVGTTQIQVVPPSGPGLGFSTPTTARVITATVTAPGILFSGGVTTTAVGENLQTQLSISLGATPPGPVTVTVTVASTGIATIVNGNNATVEGSSTVTFTNVTTASVGSIFVQGRAASGTTTITAQAPGYADAVLTVTTQPSGFIITPPREFLDDNNEWQHHHPDLLGTAQRHHAEFRRDPGGARRPDGQCSGHGDRPDRRPGGRHDHHEPGGLHGEPDHTEHGIRSGRRGHVADLRRRADRILLAQHLAPDHRDGQLDRKAA